MSIDKSDKGNIITVLNSKTAGLFMFLSALLAPYILYINSNPYDSIAVQIHGMIWVFQSNSIPPVMFLPLGFFTMWYSCIPLILLRSWFAFEIYRCYNMQVTRKHPLIVGLITELVIAIPVLLTCSLNIENLVPPFISFSMPLPILFLVGVSILFITPPPSPLKTAWQED